MSMDAVFEVSLVLEKFRNVDLLQQGIYCLVLEINGCEAIPCYVESLVPEDLGLITREQIARLDKCVDDRRVFTRAFRVQFIEQVVRIDQVCVFKVHVPARKLSSLQATVQVQLLFKEMHANEYARGKPMPSREELRCVSKKEFRIRGIEDGLHAFHPLTFEEKYFCLLDITIHSTLSCFQFRPKEVAHESQEITQQRHPKMLLHALFPKLLTAAKYHAEEIAKIGDEHHGFYVLSLIQAYNTLAKRYEAYTKAFLSKSECKKYEIDTEIKEIELGSDMTDPNALSNLSPRKFVLPRLRKLSDRLSQKLTCRNVAENIQKDINFISVQIFQIWQNFQKLIYQCNSKISLELYKAWKEDVKEHWGSCIFRETLRKEDRVKLVNSENHSLHSHASEVVKNSGHVLELHPLSIEDLSLANNPNDMILIFEQSYNKNTSEQVNRSHFLSEEKTENQIQRLSNEKTHVVVLVHGYQGTSWDMRMFRNYMSVLFPNYTYFSSSVNEGQTEGSIEEMGVRLADELSKFFRTTLFNFVDRISFVVHSLGGLIVRSALGQESMRPYLKNLHTLFSLGSPHCGFIFASTALLSAGVWVLKKIYKSKCLEQLSLSDHSDPRETFIYKLSSSPNILKHFKNIILVSSPTDKYAPYHSVRIDHHPQALNDRKYGLPYQEIVTNLHDQMKDCNLIRFDVCFMTSKSNLDTLIGREAHICFLDRPLYILMFLVVYEHLFV